MRRKGKETLNTGLTKRQGRMNKIAAAVPAESIPSNDFSND
jgi:hypothetical protein